MQYLTLLAIAGTVSTLFALGIALLTRLEQSVTYRPSRSYPNDFVAASPRFVNIRTPDGIALRCACFMSRPFARWIIFFGDNRGNVGRHVEQIVLLSSLGFNVLAVDYRGFGKNAGSPTESGLYTDALAVYRFVVYQLGVHPRDIVLYGRSLGAAVAIRLATRARIGAIIAEGCLLSTRDLARDRMGWRSAWFLVPRRFDALNNVFDVKSPILLLHGSDDSEVPAKHGHRLFDCAINAEKREFWEATGLGHFNLHRHPDYSKQILAFITDNGAIDAQQLGPVRNYTC